MTSQGKGMYRCNLLTLHVLTELHCTCLRLHRAQRVCNRADAKHVMDVQHRNMHVGLQAAGDKTDHMLGSSEPYLWRMPPVQALSPLSPDLAACDHCLRKHGMNSLTHHLPSPPYHLEHQPLCCEVGKRP